MHQNIKTNNNNQKHIPVLLDAVLSYLAPQEEESYLDLTAGYGGHTSAILEYTKRPDKAVLVDRDNMAVGVLTERFADSGAEILHKDFFEASQELIKREERFDVILVDLGVSSPHLDIASRGFAFRLEGPLDMRMDQRQEVTAREIVNTYSVQELAAILKRYGEEPRAQRIAKLIVDHRPIETTTELAAIVAKAYPRYSKTHPATRTFQALRIVVNDELELLRQSLPLWVSLLNPGGRLGVITFHSLEDRIVKDTLKELAGDRYDAPLKLLSKKPVVGDNQELVFNPRARSAKLRAAVKIKIKEREAHANSG